VLPFFVNKGFYPRLQIQKTKELSSTAANKYMNKLELIYHKLKESLEKAQSYYQVSADRCREKPPIINVGEAVFVLVQLIRSTWPSRKLSERYLGPFIVTEKLGK